VKTSLNGEKSVILKTVDDKATVYRYVEVEGVVYLVLKTVNEDGETVVHVKMIEDSKEGGANAGIKVKGTIHWVDAQDCVPCEVDEFDYLLDDLNDGRDFSLRLVKDSKTVYPNAKAESFMKGAPKYSSYQFMRNGYYVVSGKSTEEKPVYYQIVGLKDSYKK
ncbi:MAG: hypothetical protein IKC60_04355, partial [Clostridia bacterium]|nr:hypothetical protein [Clostridia bacterium]